jgi:hypothetical protein
MLHFGQISRYPNQFVFPERDFFQRCPTALFRFFAQVLPVERKDAMKRRELREFELGTRQVADLDFFHRPVLFRVRLNSLLCRSCAKRQCNCDNQGLYNPEGYIHSCFLSSSLFGRYS